jgi:hypothetical protein
MGSRTCWRGHLYFGDACEACAQVDALEKVSSQMEQSLEHSRDEAARERKRLERERKEADHTQRRAETDARNERMAAQQRHNETLAALAADQRARERQEQSAREERAARDEQIREERRQRDEQRRLEREEARAERETARNDEKFRRAHRIEIEAEALLRRAELLLQRNDAEGAEPIVRQALGIAPHWPWCWLHLAVCQTVAGTDSSDAARKALGLAAMSGVTLKPALADHESTPWLEDIEYAADEMVSQHDFAVEEWPDRDDDVFLYWLSRTSALPAAEFDELLRNGRGQLAGGTFQVGLALVSKSPAARQIVYRWAMGQGDADWMGRFRPIVSLASSLDDEETINRTVEEAVKTLARWPQPGDKLSTYRGELVGIWLSLKDIRKDLFSLAPDAASLVEPALEEQGRRSASAEADWLAVRARSQPTGATARAAQEKAIAEIAHAGHMSSAAWAHEAQRSLASTNRLIAAFRASTIISARSAALSNWIASVSAPWTGHTETDRLMLAELAPHTIAGLRSWLKAFGRFRATTLWPLGGGAAVLVDVARRWFRRESFFETFAEDPFLTTVAMMAAVGIWSAVMTWLTAYLVQWFRSRRQIFEALRTHLASLATAGKVVPPPVEERDLGEPRFVKVAAIGWAAAPLVLGLGLALHGAVTHYSRRSPDTTSASSPAPEVLPRLVSGERRPFVMAERPRPQHTFPQPIDFGSGLRLLGYDLLAPDPLAPGQEVTISWYWHCRLPIEPGWQLATHLDDLRGNTANFDLSGEVRRQFPLSNWRPDEYVRDTQQITIPSNWSSNVAHVYLLAWRGGERMPLSPSDLSDGDRRLRALSLPVSPPAGAQTTPTTSEPPISADTTTGVDPTSEPQAEPRHRRRHRRHH